MIVLVTGCRSGFGLLIAVSAARAGHTVYAGLRDLTTASALVEAAGDLDVRPVQLDVTSPSERAEVVAAITAEHGRVDVLVNNAGIAVGGPLEEQSEAELRRVFEVNFFGLWELTRLVLPGMRDERSGLIVNVTSMAGRMALPCLGSYAASKHAVKGLTEALRMELDGLGVRVTNVEPGPYATDIFGRNKRLAEDLDEAGPYADLVRQLDRMSEAVLTRSGDPQDVADLVVRLIDDPAPAPRYALGPTTRIRRFLRWATTDATFERVILGRIRGS